VLWGKGREERAMASPLDATQPQLEEEKSRAVETKESETSDATAKV
jgi:hypothetical protein